jgi:ribosomal protein S6--L-glutamate ligase
MDKLTFGWEEWVSLPQLCLPAIKAKIDTGAKTSSLHAFSIEVFGGAEKRKVRFGIHPIPERPEIEVYCTAKLVDQREIISSNGDSELRYIIETRIEVGGQSWPIEISLTNREGMAYRMLIGRQALKDRVLVDPVHSHVQGELSAGVYSHLPPAAESRMPLRIAILSREPDSYSTRRLVEAAEARNHMVDVINTTRCYMNINAKAPEIHYDGRKLPHYDAVIPRIGASITEYGRAVVRQFEMMGSYCLASSDAIGASRDKLYAHQVLASNGIAMPTTGFARSPQDTRDLVKIVGGAPLVIKLVEGTQGRGVVLAETTKAAESVIDAFRGINANILVQEFVKEAGGADIRCFVVGKRLVASMKRQAEPGEYRSNLHRGGKPSKVRVTAEERELAIKAARCLGLQVAGVDLLRAADGPKIIEVNNSPGLEGIETVSGADIAGLIVEHIERRSAKLRGKQLEEKIRRVGVPIPKARRKKAEA